MFDIAVIGAALTSLKAIMELARNANDAQLALRISTEVATIQGKLIEVQQQTMALQAENHKFQTELITWHERDNVQSRLRYDGQVFWLKQTDSSETPVCPVCWGDQHKILHLSDLGRKDWTSASNMLLLRCNNHVRPLSFFRP